MILYNNMQHIKNTDEAVMNFKKILMNCTNNIKYAEQIIISEGLKMNAKDFMNAIIARNRWIVKELELRTSRELAQTVKREISENDESISFQNVIDMMALMDDNERLELEDLASEIIEQQKYKITAPFVSYSASEKKPF